MSNYPDKNLQRVSSLTETQKIKGLEKARQANIRDVIAQVYNALVEKGYNPVSQLVGYILSGDPTYITGHNNARNIIGRIQRDELLEEVINFYLTTLAANVNE